MPNNFSREEKWIISLVGFSHLASHSLMLIFPTLLLTLKQEFQCDLFQLGKIQNVAFFIYGLGAIPAGFMADWLGSRNLLLIFLFGSGLAALFAGFTQSLLLFAIAIWTIGLFGSLYHPSGLSLVSKTIRRRSEALGFHGIAGSLGLALSPAITGLIASFTNWRWAYILFGASTIIIAFLTLFKLKSSDVSQMTQQVSQESKSRRLQLAIFLLSFVLLGLSYRGFITFFPTHFSQNSTSILTSFSSVLKGGFLTTLVLIAGIPGQYLGGKLGERFQKEKLMFWIITLNVPLLIAISYLTNLPLLFTALVFGLVHFSFQPVGNGILASYTNATRRGLGYGLQFFLSFGLGSFSASISGYIAETLGVNQVFFFMGLILIPVILLSVLLIYLQKEEIKTQTT